MSPLVKSALIENQANSAFLHEYEFKIDNGKTRTIRLAPSIVDVATTFRHALLNAGAVGITPEVMKNAKKSKPKRRIVYAARTGWANDGKLFVLQTGVVGKLSGGIIGIAPVETHDQTGVTTIHGTRNKWPATVGTTARKSTIAMFAISSALAAPLLKTMNEQSFGFCIFGSGGSGKTIATLAASSVIGIGHRDVLPNWNATEAGLEPYLSMFNDCLLPIDDFSKLRVSGDMDRFKQIEILSYTVLAGEGRRVSPKYAMAVPNAQRCAVVAITSAEKSIEDLAKLVGRERQGGATRRLIDVAACYNGSSTIFDRASSNDLVIQENLLKKLATECVTNCGTVLPAYVRRLQKTATGEIQQRIDSYQRKFSQSVSRAGDDVVLSDIARKMGLVYAAGRIGIEHQILPWSKDELLDAITKVYSRSREQYRTATDYDRESLLTLKTYLKELPLRKSLVRSQFDSTPGYRETKDHYFRCVLRVAKFRELFVNGAQAKRVKDILLAKGRLVPMKVKANEKTKTPMEQHKWPNDKRVRSYEIRWPRNAK